MQNKEIRRWIEDVKVDPLLRKTIDAARKQGPEDANLARVTAGVMAGLGIGGVAGADSGQRSTAGGSGSPGAVHVGSLGVAKLVGIGIVVCSLSAALLNQLSHRKVTDKPAAAAIKKPEPAPVAESAPAPTEPEPVKPEPAIAYVKPLSAPAPKSSARPIERYLEHNPAEEVRLLQQAKRSLPNAPAEALNLTREHERRFGDGAFAEEREALAVEALYATGSEAEAQAAFERFEQRYPRSVYIRRIQGLKESNRPR